MSANDGDDYLFDKAGEPDGEVARLESALAPLRYTPKKKDRLDDAEARERLAKAARTARVRRAWRLSGALVLAAMLLLAFGISRIAKDGRRPTLTVRRIDGAPRIDDQAVGANGQLGVGAWLETNATSRAEIALADLGTVNVAPGSRVRLVATSPREQRLELAAGRIDAKVLAPPRLFVVETPGARAIDLGCAYQLEVLAAGGSRLRVTSGAVELVGEGREAHVPAGASCETRPSRGPGAPTFDDAPATWKALAHRVDFDPGDTESALVALLDGARTRDTLTLWHMVFRGELSTRLRILARITELVPPANDIDLVGGGPPAYQRYQDQLMTHW